jgi:hypothetical protein
MLEVVVGILMRWGQLLEDVQQLYVYVCTMSCSIVGCIQVLTDKHMSDKCL